MLKTLRKPKRKALHIGPEDHGKPMPLDHFTKAIGREGYRYELNQGVIEVANTPSPKHGLVLQEIRDQLVLGLAKNRAKTTLVAGAGAAKILVETLQSERHPDLSVYLCPPPDVPDVWSVWIPTVVVEVVAPDSIKRDYRETPAEYLKFGIRECWIVDPAKSKMTALLRWRGRWKKKVVKQSQLSASTHLPGFSLDLKRVMAAGK